MQTLTNVYKYLHPTTNGYYTTNFCQSLHFRGMEIRQTLSPGSTYHICTRSNGDDLLFRDTDDYCYFRHHMHERLSHAWEIISWVMIPNELHMVIRIKDFESEKPVSHAHLFGHVLNGYVQHYNRKYARQGSLLNRSFRRRLLKNNDDLKDTICLIDNLPVARGLVMEGSKWKHGSYFEICSASFVNTLAEKITTKFSDTIDYIRHHTNEELTKYSILPPRKWTNRWNTPYHDLQTGVSVPPFG